MARGDDYRRGRQQGGPYAGDRWRQQEQRNWRGGQQHGDRFERDFQEGGRGQQMGGPSGWESDEYSARGRGYGYGGEADRPAGSQAGGYRGAPSSAYEQGGSAGYSSGMGSRPDDGDREEWPGYAPGGMNEPQNYSGRGYPGEYGYGERRGSNYPSAGRHAGWGGDYRGQAGPGRWSSGRPYGGGERGWSEGDRGFFDKAADEVSSWFGDEDAERRRRMDQFRGRGPKNYQRSDDRIRDDINDRLTDDGWIDASDIEVSVSGREVTLSGHVATREEKRRAEDIAEGVSGVTHVQNNLRVQRDDTDAATTMSGSTGSLSGSAASSSGSTSAKRKGAV